MFAGLTSREEDPGEFSLSKEEIELFKNLGMHAVYLHICGELKQVLVDDYFPFDDSPEGDGWAFSKTNTDCEFWVPVIEKAVAKSLGSYEMMEGGKPYQAFNWLTGFPSHCLFHKSVTKQELWDYLIDAVKEK
jgi:hypothetical protein